MQRKKNYLSGGILLVLQAILFFRMQAFEHSFEIVVISLMFSVLSLVLNQHEQTVSNALIFIQFVLLNVQFTSHAFAGFTSSLVTIDAEIFLIGLGYGNLNFLVL